MLIIAARYQRSFEQLGLSSFDRVSKFFLEGETSMDLKRVIKPRTLILPSGETIDTFYKLYNYRSPSWRFIGRASKERCEFRNYDVFARLGIVAAEAIACGEKRDGLGRLISAFILTRAIPDALTLKDFVQQRCAVQTDARVRRWRASLLQQLAEMTRKIHAARFFHYDLVWRNILVTWSPSQEPKMWWIDCPRGKFDRWSPARHRRRVKDLALLDKVASELCSARERIQFVKCYLEKKRMDAEVKKIIRATLNYRRTRWPEDWSGA